MTPAELLTKSYDLAARSGLKTNKGPNPESYLMFTVYNAILLADAKGDTVRYNYLLQQARNEWGES